MDLENSVMFTSKFYMKFLSFAYNSAAADQKLFIFGMGVPGWVLFHSTSMDPWVMPQGRARDQSLRHHQLSSILQFVYTNNLLLKKDGHQTCLSHQHSV